MRTLARLRYRWAGEVTAITVAIVLLLGCTASVPATKQDISDDVRAWVDSYEKAWNTHESPAVSAFFSEDADAIAGSGPRIVGRKAIEEWWRRYFSQIDDGRKGTFEVESLRVISPGVVLINIGSTTAGSGSSGEELPTRLARGTWVVAEHDGKWQISAFRALPAEGEVRFSPGRDR